MMLITGHFTLQLVLLLLILEVYFADSTCVLLLKYVFALLCTFNETVVLVLLEMESTSSTTAPIFICQFADVHLIQRVLQMTDKSQND